MAVRATLAALISRVRDLVGDPVTGTPQWTDDEIQATLDRHRARWLQHELTGTFDLSGQWLYYQVGFGNFEADAQLLGGNLAVINPNLYDIDLLSGTVTFHANNVPPVFITGWTFDIYGAAADLLEQDRASNRNVVDWMAEGVRVASGDKVKNAQVLIDDYRRLSGGAGQTGGVQSIRLTRNDTRQRRRVFWGS